MTTAAELDQMTLAERQAHFEASLVTDLTQVPEPFLAKVRARLQTRIDSHRPAE